MNLRILALVTDAFGGAGGIAQYNRDIVRALAEMPDVDEIIMVPRHVPFPPENAPDKVRFVSRAAGSKTRYLYLAMLAAVKKPNVIICGHINLLPLAVALNLHVRAPMALMVFGIDVWRPPKGLAKKWLRKVDAIWSISTVTRDRMNAWAGLPEGKYVLLPNAVHLGACGVKEKRTDLLNRYGLANSKVIMTLARLSGAEQYKGVDEVLEAMPALLEKEPSLKYVVAGEGDDRPRLERKAQALGLAEEVIFTGLIEEEEKADHFRLADAFVMPGRGEGFGFVYLEALACGVPAVGSRVDGSRDALRNGMLGELVDPMDPESIRRGIMAALAKPKGVPEGLEYFAWPAFSQRMATAMHSLVA